MKIVGATEVGGLWALEWAWHIRVTNLKNFGYASFCPHKVYIF